MAKDDSQKGKTPESEEGQPKTEQGGSGRATDEDAPTVMLQVPPHLMADGDATTHDSPTAIMVEPPDDLFDEADEAATRMLVDAEAARRAAEAALEADDSGLAGEATEDRTPPVMWINPKKKRDSGAHARVEEEAAEQPSQGEDEGLEEGATQVLVDPQKMVEQWRAGQESSGVRTDDSVEEREAATVMLDSSAQEAAAEEGATVLLEAGGDGDDEGQSVDEAFETVMLSRPDAEEPEPEETVALDAHEARISSEYEAVEPGKTPAGAIKMGAAAEAMFSDPYAKIDVDDQAELDITADPRVPEVGEVIGGRYKVTRVIGQGGFAAVFEATDEAVSGKVAVKVLQAEKSVDEDFAKRFKQEVLVVRQLHHPNSIKISDTGTTDRGCLYMVMEYIDGTPLDAFINKTGALDPARVVRISEQVLKALAEAHSKGIIHRDLKPPNIMLTQAGGESDYVKVLDFGIAKALEPDLTQVQTKTGIVFCTPRYAPPEILTGREISPAADVYAMGLIMTELLWGKPVVATPSDAEAIAYQLSPEDVPIPPEIVDTPLGRVLRKATSKKVEERYADAGEMLAAVRKIGEASLPTVPLLITSANPIETGQLQFDSTLQFLDQSGQAATLRVGEQTQLAPAERRSRWGTVAAGLAALAAIAVIVVMFTTTRTPQEPAPQQPQQVVTPTPPGQGEPQPPGQEEVAPRGPTAREILAARLAASDWEAGSWIEPEEVQRRLREHQARRARVAPEGTGETVAAVEGTGEGTGQEVTGLVPLDFLLEEQEVDPKLEAERLANLYESAESTTSALNVLQTALAEGDVTDEELALVRSEMLQQTETLVSVLVEMDRCGAAERRLNSVLESAQLSADESLVYESLLRQDIEACRRRVAEQAEEWDPAQYLAFVSEGDRLYEEAVATPAADQEERRSLLYQSVHMRQQAIDMLSSALGSGTIPESHRDSAGRDLAQLNEQVVATLMDLQLNVAVDVQIEETVENAELLPEDKREDIAVLQTALEVEQEQQQEEAALARAEARSQGEGTGEGTGEAVGLAPIDEVPTSGWDWRAHYAELAQASQEAFERAADVEIAIRETRRGCGTDLDCDLPQICLEGFCADPQCATDIDCGAELVCAEGRCTEPQGPPVYSVLLRVRSDPSGVRVVIDGETVGRTPYEGTVESTQDEVRVSLRKTDYDTERFSINMLEGGEVDRTVELRLENPFGATSPLADQLRRRRDQ